jgi:hypothetical protein
VSFAPCDRSLACQAVYIEHDGANVSSRGVIAAARPVFRPVGAERPSQNQSKRTPREVPSVRYRAIVFKDEDNNGFVCCHLDPDRWCAVAAGRLSSLSISNRPIKLADTPDREVDARTDEPKAVGFAHVELRNGLAPRRRNMHASRARPKSAFMYRGWQSVGSHLKSHFSRLEPDRVFTGTAISSHSVYRLVAETTLFRFIVAIFLPRDQTSRYPDLVRG